MNIRQTIFFDTVPRDLGKLVIKHMTWLVLRKDNVSLCPERPYADTSRWIRRPGGEAEETGMGPGFRRSQVCSELGRNRDGSPEVPDRVQRQHGLHQGAGSQVRTSLCRLWQ